MERPAHLPDFDNPPLNEVVLGVQFGSIAGYNLIRAGEVWNLYRDRYPVVQNQPPMPPQFETFGDAPGTQGITFQFGNPAEHPRFWFLTETGHDLIQFEATRLLHNWRQIDGLGGVYPRFEKMAEDFRSELMQLESFAKALSGEPLSITQVELSYINRIYTDTDGSGDWPFNYLSFVSPPSAPEAGGGAFQFVLRDRNGPIARHYIEYGTARDASGQGFIALSQTIRGAPREATIGSGLDFIRDARQFIVESFARMTTAEAHRKWERTQ